MRKSKQAKIEPCTLMIICFLDIREAFWMVPRGQDPLKLKYMHFVAFMDLSSSNHPIFGTSIDNRHRYIYCTTISEAEFHLR